MAALWKRPLSKGTMNSGMGALGAMLDVEVPSGWLPVIERLYDELEALPEGDRPSFAQVKEKFASLRVYHSGGSDEAEFLIGIAVGECSHRCQTCGERGRHVVVSGWHAVLCASHTRAAIVKDRNTDNLAGVPWPKFPVLVDLSSEQSSSKPGSQWHTLRAGVLGRSCGRFDHESVGEIGRYLHPDDAVVYALDAEETAARLDELVFAHVPRPFDVLPARPALLTAAGTLGIADDEIDSLIALSHVEQGNSRPAWYRLTRILRGEPGGEDL